MRTVTLLILSNIFMTIAWYGHLKNTSVPLWKAILVSWLIAFVEYCLMVPANRLGKLDGFNGFQLKMIQEVVTLIVFTVFAILYLKESFRLNYLYAFLCLLGAVFFMFKR